ncbi:hypothetical protein [Cystobacter fuscus]|uniref:hypothetical protein n=1 Tax=Cystobacter fuscus TaxID=43 RepID=UPI002B2C8E1A|nr:S8/S53 family peptidase [Cystobacter fuscus]
MNTYGVFVLGCLVVVAGAAEAGDLDGPPQPTTKIKHVLIVAPTQYEPSERAELFSVLSEQTPKDIWKRQKVSRGDTVYELIDRKYQLDVTDKSDRQEARAVYKSIAEANQLDDKGFILEGQELSLPPLPAKRLVHSPKGLTTSSDPSDKPNSVEIPAQVINLKDGEVYVTDLNVCPLAHASDVCRRPDGKPLIQSYSGSSPSTWLLSGDEDQLTAAAGVLQSEERAYYLGPTVESILLELPGTSGPGAAVSTPVSPLPPPLTPNQTIVSLNPMAHDELYLLDFYGNDTACAHGNKVHDVAQQVLQDIGAPQFASQINPVELAFYPFNPDALDRLDRFIRKYRQEVRVSLEGYRNLLVKQYRHNTNKHIVPILYLVALYDELLERNPSAIISSSFFTTADPFKVFPNSFKPGGGALLFSAALNTPGDVEDTPYEPQKTFWQLRHDYGVVLVGGTDTNGKAFGMSSSKGAGLSCLARGAGYRGRCVTEDERGASFATPAVASMLLVARSFWRLNNEPVSGVAAKRRLLLASRPYLQFKQSAAMGSPQPDKLFLKGGSYAFSKGQSAVVLPLLRGSVTYQLADGEDNMRRFKRGEISGIDFQSDSDFLFFDDIQRWVPAKIVSLNLSFQQNGVTVPFDRAAYPNLEGLVAP